MTSLSKQWQNSDLHENKQVIYHSKGTENSSPKTYFLFNLSHCVKSKGNFRYIWLFTISTHQIWSYHVTQYANFEKFHFVLILHLILGKVTKCVVEKLSASEVSQKPHE